MKKGQDIYYLVTYKELKEKLGIPETEFIESIEPAVNVGAKGKYEEDYAIRINVVPEE